MLSILLAFVALCCALLAFVLAKKIEVLAIGVGCLAAIHLLGAI